MRKLMAAVFVASSLVGALPYAASAGSFVTPGNYVGQPAQAVVSIFAQFPNGGDGLINAVRELLLQQPALADDVAFLASRGTPEQQLAAGLGMSQAVVTFTARGNGPAGATIVAAAQSSGNPILQTQVTTALASTNGGSSLYPGQFNSNPNTVSCQTVSPTSPGQAC